MQKNLFGVVRQPDIEPLLTGLLDGVQAAVMAFGYFHYTSERFGQGVRLVIVSPRSFSRFDSDHRARFTIFTWDDEWQAICREKKQGQSFLSPPITVVSPANVQVFFIRRPAQVTERSPWSR